jgi:DNA-binding transcriptional LysR family regulator
MHGYTDVMDLELRHLRCLLGVVENGSFTDAAIELGISQAAVSRNVAALEHVLGVRLMRRTTRSVELTPAGDRTVRHARRALSILADLQREALSGGSTVRIGYAWSALGRHTPEFQRRWAAAFPDTELRLVRTNTTTAGLAEGRSDFAILRRVPDAAAFDLVLIGVEKRYCAMATEDPLAGKRSVTLAQVGTSLLAIDVRTGSTQLDLWPEGSRPERTVATDDVDDWLTVIGSGKARGITAESTAHQYRRRGLVYRPVRDASPVPVYAAWSKTDPPAARQQVIELLAGLYS